MGKPPKNLTPVKKRLFDARVGITATLWGDIPKLYNHAVLCSVGLPYRRTEERVFTRTSGATTLRMEAGAIPKADGSFEEVGLPYGARSRLILLHLCSEAIRQQSPIIDVDASFTAFAKALGLSINGRALKSIREQTLRMAVVSMRLSKSQGGKIDVFQGHLFQRLRAEITQHARQLPLWASKVEFSPSFYASIENNAVPMRRDAIMALKHSARALDIYAWLVHRLWRVRKPISVRWTSLRWQFGNKTQEMRSFKREFKTALKQVLLVYPEAKVEVIRGGLLLRKSLPPIAPNRKSIYLLEG